MREHDSGRVSTAPDKTIQLAAPVRVTSKELLGARGELIIEHDRRDYCLRLTRNGKLILTA